jgi:hypothetical protein
VPLNPTPQQPKGYESYSEMVDDLRSREKHGDPEAKATINYFLGKTSGKYGKFSLDESPISVAKKPRSA